MAKIYQFVGKDGILMKRNTPEYILDLRRKRKTLTRPDVMNSAIRTIYEEADINEVPVDVSKIAKKLGFDIFYGTFQEDNVYGSMWDGVDSVQLNESESSNRFIMVNKDDTKERQAFTIAHEIGHFVIHCDEESNFYERYHGGENQNSEEKRIEDEADFFAANLVLPSFLILGYVMNNRFMKKEELIDKICKQFNVEVETVNRRFDELGLIL